MIYNFKKGILLKIVNIVVIVKLKNSLDLDFISFNLKDTEMSKSRWLKMRLMPENYYIAFYRSGKILITGLKNMNDIEEIVEKILSKLRSIDVNNSLENISIANIVLMDKIELKISLDKIINLLNDSNVSYEPEQFPGLFYKDKDGINYTLFSNGSITSTGSKKINHSEKKLNEFKKLIYSLEKKIV